MMECPRCGFVQPEDRFCANCGLNIATYKVKPPPLWQRMLARPSFYVALLIFITLGMGVILTQRQPVQRPRVTLTTGSTAPVATSSPGQAESGPSDQGWSEEQTHNGGEGISATPPPPAAPPDAKSLAPSAQEPSDTEPTPAKAGGGGESKMDQATAPAKFPAQLDVQFFEVPRSSWQAVASEGKIVSDQAQIRVFSFANRERLLSAQNSGRSLGSNRHMSSQPSNTLAINYTTGGASAAPQGLMMDLSVVRLDANELEIEIAGQVDLRHEGGQETHAQFEVTLSLSASGALAVTNLLPHRSLPAALSQAFATTPLAVFDSPDFLENSSELVMIIQGR